MADPIKAILKIKEERSFSSPERQSPGILDDYSVRKHVTTQSLRAGTATDPALYVDSVNNRVGVGTNAPNVPLEIKQTATTAAFRILRGGTSNVIDIQPPAGTPTTGKILAGTTSAQTPAIAFVNTSSGAAAAGDVWMGPSLASGTPNFVYDCSAVGLLIQVTGANAVAVASAILELSSTTKGFLPPRMTTTQKNNISSPATGLMVYDTTLNKVCVYTGAAWETMTSV